MDKALISDDPKEARDALESLKSGEKEASTAIWLRKRIKPLHQEEVEVEELEKYRKALLDELREATEASEDALIVVDDVYSSSSGGGGSWDGAPEDLELRLIAALAKVKEAGTALYEQSTQEMVEKGEELLHALYKRRDRKAVQELHQHREKCGAAVVKEQQMMTMVERKAAMMSPSQDDGQSRRALTYNESSSWTIVEEVGGISSDEHVESPPAEPVELTEESQPQVKGEVVAENNDDEIGSSGSSTQSAGMMANVAAGVGTPTPIDDSTSMEPQRQRQFSNQLAVAASDGAEESALVTAYSSNETALSVAAAGGNGNAAAGAHAAVLGYFSQSKYEPYELSYWRSHCMGLTCSFPFLCMSSSHDNDHDAM